MGCGASSTDSAKLAPEEKDGIKHATNGYIKAKYEKLRELGQGASCVVNAVKCKDTGKTYAMKRLKKSASKAKDMWQKEYTLLEKLAHPNVLEFVDKLVAPDDYLIITGLCQGGELFDRVDKGALTYKVAASLTRMMLIAVDYIHEHKITHRDIKPENFVFDGKGEMDNMRLIDFGCAEVAQDDEVIEDVAGSPYYVAPEVLSEDLTRDGAMWRASDIWSIGVVIFLFVCGYVPFNSNSQNGIFQKIKRGTYKIKSDVPDDVKQLIDRCLEMDPRTRITAKEALQHPWVKGDTATDVEIDKDVVKGIVNFGQQCKLKKAVGKVLSNNMGETEKAALSDLFKKFDKDGNGKLEPAEIAEMLKFIDMGDQDAQGLMKNLDEDGDGALDLDELAAGQQGAGAASSEAELKASFKMFDKDGDGFVSPEEIEKLCHWMKPEERKELLNEADASGDGKIDFDEWIKAMSAGGQKLRG